MAKDLLVEIGLEELPARFIDDAEKQLKDKTENWLHNQRISYNAITSFSTPRRLAVLVEGTAEEQTSLEEEVKGPAVHIAKDENDNWTKAATGFTKGQGKTVEDIYTKDVKGTTYIFVNKQIIGKATSELLPAFSDIIESIQFSKNMRWGDKSLRYARPIRWIAALFGSNVIPFEVAGVRTGDETYGHRFLGERVSLGEPGDYQRVLKNQYVIVDPEKREQLIADGLKQIETDYNFQIPADEDLLQEVRNLVEYPTVFIGSFDASYLKLPSEVLVSSMKEHQRYFPVKARDGDLLPYFIGVRNGDDYAVDTVVKGNEKVLRARLSDAQFFFEEDQKQTIDYYMEKLERIVFQEKLGTIGDKVNRVTAITDQLSRWLHLDKDTAANAYRTAEICKFDLPTNMVDEFTKLQGIIGETYALNAGEEPEVARAVAEHYLPIQADGKLPETTAGAIVSIADKLDTIVGCITAGLVPTGSQDPYGLRRQASGVLKILRDYKWHISVESLLNLTQTCYQGLDIEPSHRDKAEEEVDQFFRLRATYMMREMTIEQDVIQAVLHREIGVVPYMLSKAGALSQARNNPDFKSVQEALVRVLKLSGKTDQTDISISDFQTSSEKALYNAYEDVKIGYQNAIEQQEPDNALSQLGRLTQPIHAFFDHNMVMTDDETIRQNRLALLDHIAALIFDYADLSVIEWKQHF